MIYIVDDSEEICITLSKTLTLEGFEVEWTTDPTDILGVLRKKRVHCCLLDMKLNGTDGIELLEQIKALDPRLPVVIITAYDSIRTVVAAIKNGAFNYLAKPIDNTVLKTIVREAVKKRELYWSADESNEIIDGLDLTKEMGRSEIVRTLNRQCRAVCQTSVAVLIEGESGTGKELVAKRIHQHTLKRGTTFIEVDCASIPDTLIEGELFGHEKGAFTGADRRFIGKIEQANGGTLFLDELSNIPHPVQAKLLRCLETHTFTRLGGTKPTRVDIRIISATNKELKPLVSENKFRADLYHRLNEFQIKTPSLRERLEDIPMLCHLFIDEFKKGFSKNISGVTDLALNTLMNYSWPGNVRELRNALKRAMVVASEQIEPGDLPEELRKIAKVSQRQVTIPLPRDGGLKASVNWVAEFVEKELIKDALETTNGLKVKAARLLKIDEKTLYNKLRRYNKIRCLE